MPRVSLRANADDNRFVLRAELRCEGETVVSYAFDVTPSSAFVATEWSGRTGNPIALRLSFPRLLEPVELAAVIAEQCDPSGPGAPAGLRLSFEPDDRLSALLARAADENSAIAGSCRILFVEDNHFIRDVFDYGLRVFFEARGAYTVHHAESVDDAWQQLASGAYDVAIVDYYLTAGTGANLIERVRADQRIAHLPIVAVSVGGRDARDASLAAGADLFLDKPLAFRDLFNTLRILNLSPIPTPLHAKKRVLVFDDSPMVLEVTRAALESAGFAAADRREPRDVRAVPRRARSGSDPHRRSDAGSVR